ncbi:MAG: class I SAM-dependent RNA methyltransferase [Desulfovibrionales bacterium]
MTSHELTIEKLVWRGRGLGRLDSGRVVMVEPGVLPGERVLVQETETRKDMLFGRPETVIKASPLRRPHPCPRSDFCGGCRFGMTSARNQLKLKKDILLDSLFRGLPAHLRPQDTHLKTLSVPPAWRYRWRAQVHVHSGRPHFRALLGSELIPLPDCLLLARPLARQMARLCGSLADGRHTIAASPLDFSASTAQDPNLLTLPLSESGLHMKLPAASFFQANWSANQILVTSALHPLEELDKVADLYAGSGNFAIPLAASEKKVLAVESDERAVRWGRKSAADQGLSISFERLDLRRSASWERIRSFHPQGLIIDPPRSGDRRLAGYLKDLTDLKTLVWVSCDVVNTCRDIRPLLDSGWHVHEMLLLDLFPQTWHMEVVFVCKKS